MLQKCPQCEADFTVAEDSDTRSISCPTCSCKIDNETVVGETKTHAAKDRFVSHFRLLDILGSGQFGTVWKAFDTKLHRNVAVKIPRQNIDDSIRDSFFREARAAAQLNHPNIISIHEVGSEDDAAFIVSDFVQGTDLRSWLSGFNPTPIQTAEICKSIALGLHHAHESGVVHRDLKPANIMMDLNDQPQIMDFGLAKRESGEASMTVQGEILGTPAYMSPEQARGESYKVDRRADIYSFGVVLFQMLTGEKPFRGDRKVLLINIINQEAPRLRSLKTSIPIDLETICLKCLEKSPESRYQTASEVAAELDRFLKKEPIEARPISSFTRAIRVCRRWPVVTSLSVGLILSLVIGIIGISSQLSRANTEWERAENNAEKLNIEKTNSERNLYVAQMAQVQNAWENGMVSEARRLLDTLIPLDDQEDLRTFEWYLYDRWWTQSQEGLKFDYGSIVRHIATNAQFEIAAGGDDGNIQIWNANNNSIYQTLVGGVDFEAKGNVQRLEYSNDGNRLFACFAVEEWDKFGGYVVFEKSTKGYEKICEKKVGNIYRIAFASDGLWLSETKANVTRFRNMSDPSEAELKLQTQNKIKHAFFCNTSNRFLTVEETNSIALWDLAALEQPIASLQLKTGVNAATLSLDDSKLIVVDEQDISQIDIADDSSMSVRKSTSLLNAKLRRIVPNPNGMNFIAVGSRNADILEYDSFELVGRLNNREEFNASIRFLDDGSKFVTRGKASNFISVWTTEPAERIGNISAHDNYVYSVEILPDNRIVTGSRDYLIRVSNANKAREALVMTHPGWNWSIAFSPDDQLLASASTNGEVRVWNVDSGVEKFRVSNHSASVQFVIFSPDGKLLASAGRDNNIYLTDVSTHVATSLPRRHTHHVNSLSFSPNGKYLVSGSNDGTIVVWDVDSRKMIDQYDANPEKELPDADIWAVLFGADNETIYFGGKNNRLMKFNFVTKKTSLISELGGDLTSLAVNKNFSILSATVSDENIIFYDLANDKSLAKFQGHSSDAMSSSFSPDGKTLVSVGADKYIKFWNLLTNTQTVMISAHDEHIHAVRFSNDGTMVASCSWDEKVKIWRSSLKKPDPDSVPVLN